MIFLSIQVPLWDAAIDAAVSSFNAGGVSRSSLWPLMVSAEYVRYLVDLSTQKFEANFARIAVFSTNFMAAFGDLQQHSQAALLTGTEMVCLIFKEFCSFINLCLYDHICYMLRVANITV